MYNPVYRITNSEPLGSLSPLKGNSNKLETTTTIAIKTKNFKSSKFKDLEEINNQCTIHCTESHRVPLGSLQALQGNNNKLATGGMSWNKILTDQVNRLREYAMENSEMGKRDIIF